MQILTQFPNQFAEIVKKMEGRFKDKITSLLKTKATKNYIKLTRAKNVYKGKKIIKAS